MIQYPLWTEGATIGVTAPSSGVPRELHAMFELSCRQMEEKVFRSIAGKPSGPSIKQNQPLPGNGRRNSMK